MLDLPAIGDMVTYRQPSHEEPHLGSMTHPAIVTGFGSKRYETGLTLEVYFHDHGIIEKIDVTCGDDVGHGTWAFLAEMAAEDNASPVDGNASDEGAA